MKKLTFKKKNTYKVRKKIKQKKNFILTSSLFFNATRNRFDSVKRY